MDYLMQASTSYESCSLSPVEEQNSKRLFSHRSVKSRELGVGERNNLAFLLGAKIIFSLG